MIWGCDDMMWVHKVVCTVSLASFFGGVGAYNLIYVKYMMCWDKVDAI